MDKNNNKLVRTIIKMNYILPYYPTHREDLEHIIIPQNGFFKMINHKFATIIYVNVLW